MPFAKSKQNSARIDFRDPKLEKCALWPHLSSENTGMDGLSLVPRNTRVCTVH